MTAYNYQRLQELLNGVVVSLRSYGFTESEVEEVRLFVDAGEYGIALETVSLASSSKANEFRPQHTTSLSSLRRTMELEDVLTEELKQQVS